MQDSPHRPALDRRTLLAGLGALGVTTALPGCADGGGSAPHTGTPLGPVADVPVGSGVVYARAQVVVTQPTPGAFRAFSAVCPHQGCTVADVSDGTINCSCHGSRFDVTSGSVVRGPAQRSLRALEVTVDAGSLRLDGPVTGSTGSP